MLVVMLSFFTKMAKMFPALETMNWRIIRLNEISALSIFVGADTEARLRNLTPASRRAQFSVYNAIDQSTVSVAIKFKDLRSIRKIKNFDFVEGAYSVDACRAQFAQAASPPVLACKGNLNFVQRCQHSHYRRDGLVRPLLRRTSASALQTRAAGRIQP